MKKKVLITLFALIAGLIFSFSYTFAAENTTGNPVEGIRNVVGGAENAIEGAAGGVANGVKSGVGATEHAAENTADNMGANDGRNTAGTTAMNDGNHGGGYTATRTAAGDATFAGMNGTTWTWIIIALVAIGVITLVWSYVKQNNSLSHDDDDRH
ncbi:MAG: hypothetical protein ACLU84_02130 [Clostridia bacterium]